ncbi:hypothetical protein HMPREF9237_00958 [Actinotignum schaalii FB123-CNA-2]|uniref:Uncharacterized protein n=1 Tax=Actinotignum schaalii FB123-CNA-2 TaxID=883067 RepID=S2VHV0_9ACTO|nr:hypothetical protein HMPREF9237_00958 [Actinotignum schaalii FB123-CNA-2]
MPSELLVTANQSQADSGSYASQTDQALARSSQINTN